MRGDAGDIHFWGHAGHSDALCSKSLPSTPHGDAEAVVRKPGLAPAGARIPAEVRVAQNSVSVGLRMSERSEFWTRLLQGMCLSLRCL